MIQWSCIAFKTRYDHIHVNYGLICLCKAHYWNNYFSQDTIIIIIHCFHAQANLNVIRTLSRNYKYMIVGFHLIPSQVIYQPVTPQHTSPTCQKHQWISSKCTRKIVLFVKHLFHFKYRNIHFINGATLMYKYHSQECKICNFCNRQSYLQIFI
jgi:hypothetical protein